MGLQGLRPKTLTSGQRAASLEQGRDQSPVLLLRLLEGPGGPMAGRAGRGDESDGLRERSRTEAAGAGQIVEVCAFSPHLLGDLSEFGGGAPEAHSEFGGMPGSLG